MTRREHWEEIYAGARPDEMSWYEEEPGLSLEMIDAMGLAAGACVLDVGAGASRLVDRLLDRGFEPGVLDLAGRALDVSRERLGARSGRVQWIEADVLTYEPERLWDAWHDRAVFHFLVDADDRARYREALERALRPRGHVVIATFAPEGPERCSGLPTLRCSPEDLAEALGDGFHVVEARPWEHTTPSGARQAFTYARFRKA